MRLLVLLLVATTVGVIACASTPKSASHTLYERRCGRCHDLYPARAFSEPQWRQILSRMQPMSGMTDAERETLETWLARGGID